MQILLSLMFAKKKVSDIECPLHWIRSLKKKFKIDLQLVLLFFFECIIEIFKIIEVELTICWRERERMGENILLLVLTPVLYIYIRDSL